jgi:hypothetical protein
LKIIGVSVDCFGVSVAKYLRSGIEFGRDSQALQTVLASE